jgi:multiple sugar transport system permease protein
LSRRCSHRRFFFLICFYIYPTVFNVANSLTDLSLFGLKRGGAWVRVDNYVELVTSPDFRRLLWNTVIWLTAVGVTVRLLAGLGLALLLTSRTIRKYRLQTVCRVLLLVPWATPPIVAILIWRWMLDTRVGVINGLLTGLGVVDHPIPFLASAAWVWPALITIITWNTLPLVTLAFIASLQSLPGELVDAARGRRRHPLAGHTLHLSATPEACDCGHGADVDVLDLQQFHLCGAHHRRRSGALYRRPRD